MSFLLATARKDLRRRARDPISLALWVGIPAMIALLLGAIAGGDSGPPRVDVLVADRDSSFVSRLLIGAAGSGESPVQLTEVTPAAGRERMDEGEASALIVLPRGFGEALLSGPDRAGPAPAVTVVTNPGQRVLPRVAVEGVRTLSDLAFYAQQLLGGSLARLTEGPAVGDFFDDTEVGELAARLNARVRGLEGVLFPPVLDLRVTTRGGGGGGSGGIGRLLLPGIVFMSLLLVSEGLAGDLWQERKNGTMSRWRYSPHPIPTLLAGKLLAGAVLAAGVSAVGFGVGALFLDVGGAQLPLAVAWSAGAMTCLVPLFYLLHLSASSQRGGNLVSNMVLFPLLMLGGSFFPFEAMPDWMAAAGAWLPNGRAVMVLRDLMSGTADPAEAAATAGVLLLFGGACFLATAAWIPRRFGSGGGGGA